MTVDKEQVDEMARIMAIMNGDHSEATKPKAPILPNGNQAILIQQGHTREDVNVMARIMEGFASATGVKSFKSAHDVGNPMEASLKKVVRSSRENTELKEALSISQTEDGSMKIGNWEISKKLHEGLTGKEETLYYIRNGRTGEKIRASFVVFESAKAIVKRLNAGADLSDPIIKEIATLEIKYRRMRQKALQEKRSYHKAQKAADEFKMDLYEAKFDAAKGHAMYYKEKIRNIYQTT